MPDMREYCIRFSTWDLPLKSIRPGAAGGDADRDRAGPGEMRRVLDEPVFTSVAPGQTGVAYEGERVIAGGWIRRDR
jgi:hypothetical protein